MNCKHILKTLIISICRTLCRLLTDRCPKISVICITKESVPGVLFLRDFCNTFLSGYETTKAASIASMLVIFVRDCRTAVIRFLRCRFV
ncbi:Fructokinase [Methanosarcina siciliae T4/M]|uniref:Fructokinase n=2 Tax=Methanosarcina siciliae TaxID=38027 RepID=A0A0E3PE15_9EURY|nr:Fructokinase [Methanosarcina siciliae T4/M]AKB32335.1 Fructokinase [Methanosarcina siciliae HI350]